MDTLPADFNFYRTVFAAYSFYHSIWLSCERMKGRNPCLFGLPFLTAGKPALSGRQALRLIVYKREMAFLFKDINKQ